MGKPTNGRGRRAGDSDFTSNFPSARARPIDSVRVCPEESDGLGLNSAVVGVLERRPGVV